MIKIHKEIKPNIYLIELEGTRYYQIWKKADLLLELLNSGKPYNLYIEDLPLPLEELEELADKL